MKDREEEKMDKGAQASSKEQTDALSEEEMEILGKEQIGTSSEEEAKTLDGNRRGLEESSPDKTRILEPNDSDTAKLKALKSLQVEQTQSFPIVSPYSEGSVEKPLDFIEPPKDLFMSSSQKQFRKGLKVAGIVAIAIAVCALVCISLYAINVYINTANDIIDSLISESSSQDLQESDTDVNSDTSISSDNEDNSGHVSSLEESEYKAQLEPIYYSSLNNYDQRISECATEFNNNYLGSYSTRETSATTAYNLMEEISLSSGDCLNIQVSQGSKYYQQWQYMLTLYDCL